MPPTELSTLAALHAAWLPLNEVHRGSKPYSSGVHLRILRCLSWASRADALDSSTDADLRFILRIVSFNSLWGRAYRPNEERLSELQTWATLLCSIAHYDEMSNNRFQRLLRDHADLFQTIFDSEFFHREYWVEPGAESIAQNRDIADNLQRQLKDGRIRSMLWEIPKRMLLLRGQVIHGNSKYDGSLNRPTVHAAAKAIDLLLRVVLEVLILDGAHKVDFEWNPVPYAPTDDETS